MNASSPPQLPITPALFRRRLRIVFVALVAAQFMYVGLALMMTRTGFKPAASGRTEQAIVVKAVYSVGALTTALSFFAAGLIRKGQLPAEFTKFCLLLQKQFFVGFAMAEVGSILGLLLFFLYGELRALLVLAVLASAAIAGHYLRVSLQLEEFKPQQL